MLRMPLSDRRCLREPTSEKSAGSTTSVTLRLVRSPCVLAAYATKLVVRLGKSVRQVVRFGLKAPTPEMKSLCALSAEMQSVALLPARTVLGSTDSITIRGGATSATTGGVKPLLG